MTAYLGIDPGQTGAVAFSFTVPGVPIAKKRPRFVRRGKFVGTYNSQETEEGRFILSIMDQIRRKGYGEALPLPPGTAIYLSCMFTMPIPKSAPKKAIQRVRDGAYWNHTKKPDLDNLVKFVKDCLNGQAWKDDSQVCGMAVYKSYDEEPSTTIRIVVWSEWEEWEDWARRTG